jgi:manganese transport protein
MFTSSRVKMGRFVNPLWITILAWTTAGIIVSLNVKYLLDFFGITDWFARLSQ